MVDLGGVVGGLTNALIPAPKPQAPPPQHQPPPNPYAQDPYAGAQNPYGRGAPPPPHGGRGGPPPGDPYGRGRGGGGGGGPPRGGGRGAGPGPPPRGGGHPQQPRVAVVEDNIPRPNLNDPGFLSDDFPKGPPKLYITAEDDEFDVETINAWKEEGFDVNYISMGSGGREYTIKLASLMRQNLGPCETYGIVAYGDAAAICLEFFHSLEKNSEFRLCCLIAYYPTRVPDPQARFPGGVKVLVHLAEGNEFIGVAKRDQMAGIQGRRRIVKRQIPQGVGVGRFIKWAWRAYAYDADGGFAETDLDEYDKVSADLAWCRSLALARRAFRRELELEKVVDEHTQGKFFGRNLKQTMSVFTNKHEPHVTHAPTMTGGVGAEELQDFYGHFFIEKNPPSLQATLISRTVGVNRVVDELHLSFKHTQEMDWILPGIPPTKKTVEIILVSIITLSGGKLRHEHVYWDQASVLVQIGLLDPKVVPNKDPFKDVKRLPVVGKKAAKRMLDGNENGDEGEADNELIPGWYESSDEEEEEDEDSGSDYEVEEMEDDEDDIVEEAEEEPAQPPPPANPRSNFKNTRVDSVSDEDRPRGAARRAEPEEYVDRYEVNEVEEPRQPARPTRPFGKAADDRSRGPPRRPEPVYEDEEPEPPRQPAKAPARAFGKAANSKSHAPPKPAPAPVPEPEYDEEDDYEVEEPPPRQPSRAPEKTTRAPSRSADGRPSRSNSPVTAKKYMPPAKAQKNAPPARRDPEERSTRPMKSESDQKPAAPAKVARPTAPAKKEPDEKPRRPSVSAPAKKVAAPAKVARAAPSARNESSERPVRPVREETEEKPAKPARKEASATRPERPPSRSIPARTKEARPETPPATPARREAPKTERPRRISRPEKHEPTPQPTPEPEEVEEETPMEEDQYGAEEDEYEVEAVEGEAEEEEEEEDAEEDGDDEVEVAGTINEDGEIIDDEGQAVGRVTEGNPADLVGLAVTLDGDVLDEEGRAVGRAEPYDDVDWDDGGGGGAVQGDDDDDMEIEEA